MHGSSMTKLSGFEKKAFAAGRSNNSGRSLIECQKDFAAQPASLMLYDTVGKVSAGPQKR
jgi:hypothetical protein